MVCYATNTYVANSFYQSSPKKFSNADPLKLTIACETKLNYTAWKLRKVMHIVAERKSSTPFWPYEVNLRVTGLYRGSFLGEMTNWGKSENRVKKEQHIIYCL